MFKVEGRPVQISPRYRPLFDAIVYREHDRVNVVAPTQDGKSLTIAIAVTLVAAITGEKFTIIAPSQKKADIIMKYIINFSIDAPIIKTQLELDKSKNLERLKRERSKQNITYLRGGGVQTLTLDAKNEKKSHEAAMGFGAKNIIADESGLVNDKLWATVLRMLGGDFKEDSRKKILIKIGNPFYDNHFKRSSESERYLQIFHNYKDSIRDYEAGYYGYKPSYIEEMRAEPLFSILYECKFPDGDEIDAKGYRRLILKDQLNELQLPHQDDVKKQSFIPIGEPRLGIDVGGGGDYNVFCIRWENYARFGAYNVSSDTMTNIKEAERLCAEYGIKWRNVFMDDIGIGRGVQDRMWEMGYNVNGVNVGKKADDPEKFMNLRAELSWKAADWIKQGGMLEPLLIGSRNPWLQATWIKYKVNTGKCIKIMPKDEIKKDNNNKSPDFWEAFKLTFFEPEPFEFL